MILVTGGSGLTGSFVVAALAARGTPVRVLARASSAERAAATGAEVAVGDLGDPDSVRRAARGVDAVVHTACTYADHRVDLAALDALLDGAGAAPLVFLSSLDVYGLGDGVLDEDSPLSESFNDYATGKVRAERAIAAGGRRDVSLLRAPYIWGPHPTARGRLVDARLREGRPIVLPGADEAEWSRYQDAWIDVRDLVEVILGCLDRPAGGPLNVLAGHYRLHDLYARLIALSGSQSPLVHKPYDAISDDELAKKALYARTWHFRDDRLRAHLPAWSPRIGLEESLAATVAGA